MTERLRRFPGFEEPESRGLPDNDIADPSSSGPAGFHIADLESGDLRNLWIRLDEEEDQTGDSVWRALR